MGRMSAGVRSGRRAARLLLLCGLLGVPAARAADGRHIVLDGNQDGAPACSACHGTSGEGNPELGYPRLAGLSPAYLARQLASFADGSRANEIMQPAAKALSSDEREAVAAYYGATSAPKAEGGEKPDAALAARGAVLAGAGAWAKGVPGCGQCHGPAGEGVGTGFPALAGQPAAYLAGQLEAWKAGTRRNDPLGLMSGIAVRLDADAVAAASAYYADLPVSGPRKGSGR